MTTILMVLAALASPPPAPAPLVTGGGCPARNTDKLPLATRKSPLDSLAFTVAGKQVKVCYGRPSARGRTMIGGEAVPYGKLWRTGANEPTIFMTPVALSVAGVRVPPGVYSLYSVPGPKEWEIIVNRSTSQWGHEREYTDTVKAQEVGRGKVRSEQIPEPVEPFTIRAEPARGDATALVLEWERTRVRIPIAAG